MLNVSDSPLFSRGLDSELAQGDEPSDEVFNLQCQVNFLTEQLAEARGGSLATDVHKELSHARQLLVSRDGDIAQYEARPPLPDGRAARGFANYGSRALRLLSCKRCTNRWSVACMRAHT